MAAVCRQPDPRYHRRCLARASMADLALTEPRDLYSIFPVPGSFRESRLRHLPLCQSPHDRFAGVQANIEIAPCLACADRLLLCPLSCVGPSSLAFLTDLVPALVRLSNSSSFPLLPFSLSLVFVVILGNSRSINRPCASQSNAYGSRDTLPLKSEPPHCYRLCFYRNHSRSSFDPVLSITSH